MRTGRTRTRAVVAAAIIGIGAGSGCLMTPPDARYVYQDGQHGVIGIPRNSAFGKVDYREQAHHLMTLHFPEGYEIVRAEEIVAGERVTDTARKIEVDSEPGINALNQMLKVGKFTKSTSLDQKDTLQITESRIIYRRKDGPRPTEPDGFADLATIQPGLYIDPNDTMRKLAAMTLLAAEKKAGAAKPDDGRAALAAKTPDPKDKPGKEKGDAAVISASADITLK